MFSRLACLVCSMLLAITPIATSAVSAFSIEKSTQSLDFLTPAQQVVSTESVQLNAERTPLSDRPLHPFEIQRPSSISPRPVFRPLAAGAPQTITVQVVPNTLIANSGATAVITATVQDITGDLVSDVILSGSITAGRGSVTSIFPATGLNGQTTGTWMAAVGSTVGAGTIQVITDTATGSALITLTAGSPASVSLEANPTSLTVGFTSALTATVRDQYNNLVANGTTVTFTSSLGTPGSPGTTTNGIATSSVNSTVAGTAHITATTAGGATGSASVVFVADSPTSVNLTRNPPTLTVGGTSVLTATVRDQYNNLVANGTTVTFTSSLSAPLSPRTTTNGIATSSLNSTLAGTAYVTATSGSGSGSTTVVFVPGPPASMSLSPATAVITAGVRITYTAIATDTYGNRIGDVTGSTTFNISPGSGGTFVGNAITPTIRGTYTVTGTNGLASDTASLVVTPSTYSRLSIETLPNGTGVPVTTHSMSVYDTFTVYAVSYDVYDNVIGSPNANWGGTGVVAGRVAPTSNNISTTFTAAVSGTGTITATSGTISDATGQITVRAPVLQISKSDGPDPVTPGTQLQYTIRYTNTSTFPAQGVVITETYPPSTTFAFASPPPTTGNNVWSLGNVAAGASNSIDVYVNVASQMPVGSVLTNTVRIGALRAATAIYTATTQVNAQPLLSADVLDSIDPVRPGQEFVYTIQYRNDGNAPATGLRITETYPSQVTYVSANPAPSVGNNVWLPNTLNGGGTSRVILVTVRVNSPIADGTIMNNQVAIDSNETVPFTVTEQTQATAPTLQLAKSANPVVPTANSLVTYTLQYTNTGSSYASNVVVTDAVPLNTVFQSCVPGCNVSSGIATWNLGTVSQQTSNAVTLVVQVNNNLPSGTILTNTARIASTELAAAFVVLTNTVSSTPDVSLAQSDGVTSAAAGDLLTYQLAYTNTGIAPAQSVVITDRIPANVNFIGCTACTAMSGGVYSFTIGTVSAAQGGVVTLSVRVNSPLPAGLRSITNTAYIRTTTPGDNPVDNSAQDIDSISTVPTLSLTSAYDGSTPYPGKIITYTLRYTNTSLMDTTGVVISTTRSPYVTVVPTGWTYIGGEDRYAVDNLASGQAGMVTYVVILTSTFTPDMNTFANTFVIHDSGPGGLPPAVQNVTTTIGVPDLIIESVSVPLVTAPNQPFTATLTIRNIGLGRACNPNVPVCGPTWVDAFVDPITQPLSYPFSGYGDPYARTPQIDPGLTATVYISNIVISGAQQPFVYFKVDNYACPGSTCLPPGSLGGLVPESNELNNVFGPVLVPRYSVSLPVVFKNATARGRYVIHLPIISRNR